MHMRNSGRIVDFRWRNDSEDFLECDSMNWQDIQDRQLSVQDEYQAFELFENTKLKTQAKEIKLQKLKAESDRNYLENMKNFLEIDDHDLEPGERPNLYPDLRVRRDCTGYDPCLRFMEENILDMAMKFEQENDNPNQKPKKMTQRTVKFKSTQIYQNEAQKAKIRDINLMSRILDIDPENFALQSEDPSEVLNVDFDETQTINDVARNTLLQADEGRIDLRRIFEPDRIEQDHFTINHEFEDIRPDIPIGSYYTTLMLLESTQVNFFGESNQYLRSIVPRVLERCTDQEIYDYFVFLIEKSRTIQYSEQRQQYITLVTSYIVGTLDFSTEIHKSYFKQILKFSARIFKSRNVAVVRLALRIYAMTIACKEMQWGFIPTENNFLEDLMNELFQALPDSFDDDNYDFEIDSDELDLSLFVKDLDPIDFLKEECYICMQKMKNGRPTLVLKCDHSFHQGCVLPWLKNHHWCPTCRRNFSE
ncbi:putative E3 ubiquitin-protein ligase RING1 [Pseudoloma neurophilia]|uniref:Putative E3 ubiquitin-protein ligase RING1 n=1 Tax=Pseudoloma neurophilia TaxID=146866 RepID=A0A0R0M0J3_9MICR|nr:putative E3 ubiquitin-protein ligase RING1 [Pseudoloma neurophilia]